MRNALRIVTGDQSGPFPAKAHVALGRAWIQPGVFRDPRLKLPMLQLPLHVAEPGPSLAGGVEAGLNAGTGVFVGLVDLGRQRPEGCRPSRHLCLLRCCHRWLLSSMVPFGAALTRRCRCARCRQAGLQNLRDARRALSGAPHSVQAVASVRARARRLRCSALRCAFSQVRQHGFCTCTPCSTAYSWSQSQRIMRTCPGSSAPSRRRRKSCGVAKAWPCSSRHTVTAYHRGAHQLPSSQKSN